MISQNRDLRVQFERRMKAERDAVALTRDAMVEGMAQGVEEGKRIGIALGIAQGMAQGVAQGMAQGVAQGVAQGMAQGVAQGMEEGKRLGIDEGTNRGKQAAQRDSVLQVLSARGISVSDAVRAHIAAETDLQRLQGWLTRAVVASRAEELLDS